MDLRPVFEAAREHAPDAIALRREIHMCPELGLSLPRTKARVLEALGPLGVEIVEHRETSGIVATLRGGAPGPTLLLRADMDALPMQEDVDVEFRSREAGAMHACGHDAHTAMLVGAAELLAARRDALHGDVRFMFQPGEEGHFGAREMIAEGVLDPMPAAAFAIHIEPRLPVGLVATRPGPLLASTDDLFVDVIGRGGHASMPHTAQDPIPVACELVQAMQTWITRNINTFDPVVLTIGKIAGGTTMNVIPESVRLEGTLRAVSDRSRARALEGIRHLIETLPAAHGLRSAVEHRPGYPVTENDAAMTAQVCDVVSELFGQPAIDLPSPVMGGEDFAYVLQQVPGAMVFLGMRPEDPAQAHPCHSNRMVLNESGLAHGIALHGAVALRFLSPPTA